MKKDSKKNISVELTQLEFYTIAREAHERDITFNERVNQILMDGLIKLENDSTYRAQFEKTIGTNKRSSSCFDRSTRAAKKGTRQTRKKRVVRLQGEVLKRTRPSLPLLRESKPQS